MKRLLFVIAVVLLLACGSARQAVSTLPPTAPPTATRDTLLGTATSLIYFFEHQYRFECAPNRDHFRCVTPDGLVKIVFFGDPVNEATISIPLNAADSKPSKYALALLLQTGLDTAAWDWLVAQMKDPEASKIFGDRRLTTQMDDEDWLVTVEAVR